jgi:hypothetical protein
MIEINHEELAILVHKLQHSAESGWSAKLEPAECQLLLLALTLVGITHRA